MQNLIIFASHEYIANCLTDEIESDQKLPFLDEVSTFLCLDQNIDLSESDFDEIFANDDVELVEK